MFRIFFYNFGYYSQNEAKTPEEAKEIARKAGFQCRIEKDGEMVASYCPLNGFQYRNRELFGIPEAPKPMVTTYDGPQKLGSLQGVRMAHHVSKPKRHC
jgi:hypothetical protein